MTRGLKRCWNIRTTGWNAGRIQPVPSLLCRSLLLLQLLYLFLDFFLLFGDFVALSLNLAFQLRVSLLPFLDLVSNYSTAYQADRGADTRAGCGMSRDAANHGA